MTLKILGCCSGVEPVAKCGHASFVIEAGEEVYWFNTGEGCSDTAHLMGVDLTRVSNIFISHTYMENMGGLFNLLWFMFKLAGWKKKTLPNNGTIGLFIPNLESWYGVLEMLLHTREGCPWDTNVIAAQIKSGLLYKDKNLEVSAFHNKYSDAYDDEENERFFSFRIQSDGITVVYSGNIQELSDLDNALQTQCDYLLVETELHTVKDVCEYINTRPVKNVIFINYRREDMYDIQQLRLIAQEYTSCNVFFAESGDSINL